MGEVTRPRIQWALWFLGSVINLFNLITAVGNILSCLTAHCWWKYPHRIFMLLSYGIFFFLHTNVLKYCLTSFQNSLDLLTSKCLIMMYLWGKEGMYWSLMYWSIWFIVQGWGKYHHIFLLGILRSTNISKWYIWRIPELPYKYQHVLLRKIKFGLGMTHAWFTVKRWRNISKIIQVLWESFGILGSTIITPKWYMTTSRSILYTILSWTCISKEICDGNDLIAAHGRDERSISIICLCWHFPWSFLKVPILKKKNHIMTRF